MPCAGLFTQGPVTDPSTASPTTATPVTEATTPVPPAVKTEVEESG